MRCTSPRQVGFMSDGKTISWSPKTINKEYATFQLPCGKCIECRLEYARQWAIRSIHQAQMHRDNSFITLTYSDENLTSSKLKYIDFQLFAKRLRDKIFRDFIKVYGKQNWHSLSKQQKKETYEPLKISIFVTGEYGDKTKRPHWHAIIFNWRPHDTKLHYTNHRGDKVFTSETLSTLWPSGHAEIGSVTIESAGYVARYAAKKLGHGKDDEHDFHPISKKSAHQAIGKKWLEKYYKDVFSYGLLVLPDGQTSSIPRYYEKWLQKNHPDEWKIYVTKTKQAKMELASKKSTLESQEYIRQMQSRGPFKGTLTTRNQARKEIQKQKFKQLQENLKL